MIFDIVNLKIISKFKINDYNEYTDKSTYNLQNFISENNNKNYVFCYINDKLKLINGKENIFLNNKTNSNDNNNVKLENKSQNKIYLSQKNDVGTNNNNYPINNSISLNKINVINAHNDQNDTMANTKNNCPNNNDNHN